MKKNVDLEVSDIMKVHNNFQQYEHVQSMLICGSNEKMEYTLSIVIPTYNRVETLRDTVQSCLNQKGLYDYDIVVVDNNPDRDDDTERYITELNSPIVKYYKNAENIGMTGNWNRCVELCDGKYAILLHDDDLLPPDYLLNIFDVLKKYHDVDIIYVGKRIWHQDCGERPPMLVTNNKRYPLYKLSLINCLLPRNIVPTGMMLKKNSFCLLGGFDERCYPSADFWFCSYAVVNGLNAFYYAKPLVTYRYFMNESLKEDTRLGFVLVTYPLRKWLLDNINLPSFIRRWLMLIMNNIGLGYCKRETLINAAINDIPHSTLLLSKYESVRKMFALLHKIIMGVIKRYLYRPSVAIKKL